MSVSQQEAMHEALQEALELPEDAVLTGWCVAYEYRLPERVVAGCVEGPATITAWQAIGLLEWARMCIDDSTGQNDDDDDDDG